MKFGMVLAFQGFTYFLVCVKKSVTVITVFAVWCSFDDPGASKGGGGVVFIPCAPVYSVLLYISKCHLLIAWRLRSSEVSCGSSLSLRWGEARPEIRAMRSNSWLIAVFG
jgi:hypothetical protein